MKRRDFIKWGLVGISAMALSDKASALQFYPRPSDKKWTVLFGGWTGTARDAGMWISEGMGGIADVFDIREGADLRTYDCIIIGSALRFELHLQVVAYARANRSWLKPKIRGLYVVCGNYQNPVGEKETERHIHNNLAKECGVKNVPSKAFGGRITKALLEADIVESMRRDN